MCAKVVVGIALRKYDLNGRTHSVWHLGTPPRRKRHKRLVYRVSSGILSKYENKYSCSLCFGTRIKVDEKKVHHYVYLYMKCEISLVVQMSWNEERTFAGTYN